MGASGGTDTYTNAPLREGSDPMRIDAPFTDEQVVHLNDWQGRGLFHPFTCGKCRESLTATNAGWICPSSACDYTQEWAHDFMADGSLV